MNGHDSGHLPTPAEIEERTAEIRKGWTPAQWRRRCPHNNSWCKVQVCKMLGDYERDYVDYENRVAGVQ